MEEDKQFETKYGDRVWNVKIYRAISPKLKEGINLFFSEHYPTVFRNDEAGLSLQWKIGQENPFGQGFLAVALLPQGEIVGIASATIRPVNLAGQTIFGIEVGDTFTAPEFRKSGRCREVLDPKKVNKTEFEIDYLSKSVFGRLMYEILIQAQQNGFRIAYGTPNKLSLRPYQKRFQFGKVAEDRIYSLYVLGNNHKNLLNVIGKAQQAFLILNYKLNKKSIEKIREMESNDWIEGYLKANLSSIQKYSLLHKNAEYLRYRYVNHPFNRYTFYKYTDKNSVDKYFILKKRSSTELQIVDFSQNTKNRDVLKIILFVNAMKEPGQKILIWRLLSKSGAFSFAMQGIVLRSNVTLISKHLIGNLPELEIDDLCIGDSDNG